jgi:tetratricopeptide (TPR) repeat protein
MKNKKLKNKRSRKNRKLPIGGTKNALQQNLLQQAITYHENKNFPQAEALFKKIIQKNPNCLEAHNYLGYYFFNQGLFEDAAKRFRKVVFLNPNFAMGHYNLGNALKEQGKLREAEASYLQTVTIEPGYWAAYNNLGYIYTELGKLSDAIACYKKTLTFNPDYIEPYFALSMLIKFTKCDDDLICHMENLYSQNNISHDDKIALGFALGKAFEDIGEYNKAFKFIFEANKKYRETFKFSNSKNVILFKKIKEVFSKELFSSHPMIGCKDSTPVFILGMPRSGTTLIEQILSSHPQVYGAGELHILEDLEKYHCNKMKKSDYPECFLAFSGGLFKKIGEVYVEKLKNHSKEATYITDKQLHNFFRVGLIKIILPNSKIIHCKRDPVDNCWSIYKNRFIAGSFPYGYDMTELGEYYKLYSELMQYWDNILPGFLYNISYEDMILDQRNQIKTKRRVGTASVVQVRKPIFKSSVELCKKYERELAPLKKAIYG